MWTYRELLVAEMRRQAMLEEAERYRMLATARKEARERGGLLMTEARIDRERVNGDVEAGRERMVVIRAVKRAVAMFSRRVAPADG